MEEIQEIRRGGNEKKRMKILKGEKGEEENE